MSSETPSGLQHLETFGIRQSPISMTSNGKENINPNFGNNSNQELADLSDFSCEGSQLAVNLFENQSYEKSTRCVRIVDENEETQDGVESCEGKEVNVTVTPCKRIKREQDKFTLSHSPRAGPVNHVMSATGDTGPWYEVLDMKNLAPVHAPVTSQIQKTDSSPRQLHIDVISTETPPVVRSQLPHPMFHTPVTSSASIKIVPTNFVYTPHPRSGQVLYITDPGTVTPQAAQRSRVEAVTPLFVNTSSTTTLTTSKPQRPCILQEKVINFSTDSEKELQSPSPEKSSPEADRESNAGFALLGSPQALDEERESHNMKERKRRARIKEACDLMRQLVPGMSDKTDKATVFEFAARYIYYLRSHLGSSGDENMDKNFLIKYSPY